MATNQYFDQKYNFSYTILLNFSLTEKGLYIKRSYKSDTLIVLDLPLTIPIWVWRAAKPPTMSKRTSHYPYSLCQNAFDNCESFVIWSVGFGIVVGHSVQTFGLIGQAVLWVIDCQTDRQLYYIPFYEQKDFNAINELLLRTLTTSRTLSTSILVMSTLLKKGLNQK